jgi:amino acid transporter
MSNSAANNLKRFGTAPVFFTAISTILGAILFLRFGFAVGTLGFMGAVLIIFLGHLVTIPTALAISEIATNKRVEGGGEYFIISRSFGLNIGATIGIALFFSQAISVAFYIIAFTESFEFLFNWLREVKNINLPRQLISLPAMGILTYMILKRGANMGVKALYVVVAVLFVSLALFFLGKTGYQSNENTFEFFTSFTNKKDFFLVFAIVFPAFTGMTAGVGLSGDLKNPSKSIPLGTTLATFGGMIMYLFIVYKLYTSASPEDLINSQLIMGDIAISGNIIIPLGLAASTISSAIGSIMVAPRTLQALANDRSFPTSFINGFLKKGKGESNEPFNASIVTCIIAFVFVGFGNVDAVAEIITMFFMVTYGSLCLISFLYHFGSDPSYRPSFRSKWYISLAGAIICIWLMFKINSLYTVAAGILMLLIYLYISSVHKERKGMEVIFRSAVLQLTRRLHVFIQKTKKTQTKYAWRPAAVCVTKTSFENPKPLYLIEWLSYKYGFGTYVHLIEGYYSKSTYKESQEILDKLIDVSTNIEGNVYLDTIISPSYTSAIAQIIQLPSVSGLDNNMTIFEFEKNKPDGLNQIIDNYSLVRAGEFDVCILGSTETVINPKQEIHVWIKSIDFENSNLMILLSYIILGHPFWKKSKLKIFDICTEDEIEEAKVKLLEIVNSGRLPISMKNIELIKKSPEVNSKSIINKKSNEAALTVIGFRSEQIKHTGTDVFTGYDNVNDIIFINAFRKQEL